MVDSPLSSAGSIASIVSLFPWAKKVISNFREESAKLDNSNSQRPGYAELEHLLTNLSENSLNFSKIRFRLASPGKGERVELHIFKNFTKDKVNIEYLFNLCAKYCKSRCLDSCKSMIEYVTLRGECITSSSEGVSADYDLCMERLIPFFTYVIFDKDATTIEHLILREITAVLEEIKSINPQPLVEKIENDIRPISNMVLKWQEEKNFTSLADNDALIRTLIYSIITLCRDDIRSVTTKAICKHFEILEQGLEYYDILSRFILENTVEEISKSMFSAVRDLKSSGLKIDAELKNNFIALILIITLLKEDDITSRVDWVPSKDGERGHFECRFYSNKFLDLDVSLSLALPKRVELGGIDAYYSKVDLVEGGIEAPSEDESDYPTLLSTLANALLIDSAVESEVKGRFATEIKYINERSVDLLADDLPRYQIVVCMNEVDNNAIGLLLSVFPGIVFVKKVEGQNIGLLSEDFWRTLMAGVNTDLKLESSRL